MLHRFHDRFGTAGVVIAVIALIAALGGTALAAGALSSKQKKEVTKIAKKYAGKAGANGTNGTNGTNGAAGAKGDKGDTGGPGGTGTAGKTVLSGTLAPETNVAGNTGGFYIRTSTNQIFGPKTGANGTNTGWGSATNLKGDPGQDGTSATTASEAAGANCSDGGIKVSSASADTYVCNGSPWVVGQAPAGATLRGTWSIHVDGATANEAIPLTISTSVPVSVTGFGIYVPLAGQNDPNNPFGCTGRWDNPTPSFPAVVCIYETANTNLTPPPGPPDAAGVLSSSSQGGNIYLAKATANGNVDAYGVWVTTIP